MKNKVQILRTVVVLFTLFCLVNVAAISTADQSGLRIPDQVTGDLAYAHVYYLSEDIGVRIAGTIEEKDTADYIMQQFEAMGYEVEVQSFTFAGGFTILKTSLPPNPERLIKR